MERISYWAEFRTGMGLPTDVHHRSGWLEEARLTDVMPRFLLLNCTEYVLAQLRVAFARAHAAVEIVLDLGEKTGADFAVGCKSHAAACSTKGLGNRRDDADLAHPIGEGITASGL